MLAHFGILTVMVRAVFFLLTYPLTHSCHPNWHHRPFSSIVFLVDNADDVEKSAGHISKITAGSDGKCEGSMKSSLIKLSGEYSVLERYVMICADKDSGSTKNSVNTGGICIAYGGIQPGKKGKIEDGKILETLEKDVAKFRLYNLDKSSFGLLKSFFDQSFEISTLAIGLMAAYWDTASWVVERYLGKDPSQSEVLVSLIFLGFMTLQGTIVDLPWSLYSTFVVEEKHGFNKTTLSLFIKDQITVLALTAVIGIPVAYLLINLVKWGGDYFYVYCWAFMFAFSILFMTVYPVYIQPLFNKYDPIEDGELKDAIYALAKRLNFPLTNLYQVDGSKRSSHSNAYLFGFGKNKRIVLFDTLIEQMTVPELEAVLGHEIGHWAHGHVLQMLVVQQVYFFAMFFGYGLVKSWEPMFLSFGFNPEAGMPTLIGLMLFSSTLWAPVDKLIGFLLTLNTRRNEFQADEFSVKQKCGEELKRGLVKMSIENRSDLNPDPLYSAYHYSHPPLLQRLSAIDAGMKKLK